MEQIQKEEGVRVKTLEDMPVLQRHLHWVWQSFTDLNYRRDVSMGGALPFTYSEIEAYCNLKGIYSLLERERLLRLLDPLDRHWMAKYYEKQKPSAARTSPPPTPKLPPRTSGPRRDRKPVS